MSSTGERFQRVVDIMARLRGPGGCPWDREQTFDSIKPYTLEEAYEVVEAIDNRDWDEMPGELGDLLLQVLFYAEMAKEEQRFTIDEVLERLASKLVGRHPHVFGDVEARTSAEVLRNWEALKAEEKKQKRLDRSNGDVPENQATASESVLAGVSSTIPSLLEAFKLSSRAAHVGFEWSEIGGLFQQLQEETEELRHEIAQLPQPVGPPGRGVAEAHGDSLPSPELRARLEDEVGDLLFVLVNMARYLALDPESALRRTNRKFKRRFQWVEEQIQKAGGDIRHSSFENMERLWQAAKREETQGT
jgi:MazG family protein